MNPIIPVREGCILKASICQYIRLDDSLPAIEEYKPVKFGDLAPENGAGDHMLERLIESLETCPLVKRGEYNYFIHPITDGVPIVEPALIREVATAMVKALDLDTVDKIVVCEAMGIHIGTVLSLMTDIPLNIVRKREYRLPGEIVIDQATGYSQGKLYVNGISDGDRVVIIDDVISTGGTIRSLLSALDRAGAEVVDICFAIQRGSPSIGRPYKSLVRIEVTDRVQILDRYC